MERFAGVDRLGWQNLFNNVSFRWRCRRPCAPPQPAEQAQGGVTLLHLCCCQSHATQTQPDVGVRVGRGRGGFWPLPTLTEGPRAASLGPSKADFLPPPFLHPSTHQHKHHLFLIYLMEAQLESERLKRFLEFQEHNCKQTVSC